MSYIVYIIAYTERIEVSYQERQKKILEFCERYDIPHNFVEVGLGFPEVLIDVDALNDFQLEKVKAFTNDLIEEDGE